MELSEFQWQRRDRALTHEALDVALRAFCERIAERAAGQTRLTDGHLPMPLRAGRSGSPYLFDESGYGAPVAAALAPPASLDELRAFAPPAVAGYGVPVTQESLKQHVGRAAAEGLTIVATLSGEGTRGVSCSLLQWGTKLFVAVARAAPPSWCIWSDYFAAPMVTVDASDFLWGAVPDTPSSSRSLLRNCRCFERLRGSERRFYPSCHPSSRR